MDAQTINDLNTTYNEGTKAMQTDNQAAFKALENVVVLSHRGWRGSSSPEGKAAKYVDYKELICFFSDVYNKQKNYDIGAEYAQKGGDIETVEP